MTAHTPAHFTPAQVLDAGFRAEAEGRYDFALQIYRHLVAQYPMSAEAHAAQEGMLRLAPPPGYDLQATLPEPVVAAQSPMMLAFAAEHPAPLASPPPAWQTPQQEAPLRRPISIAPAGRVAEPPPFVPPRPVRDYRSGRIVARLLAGTGWLNLLAGIALVPVSLMAPELLSAVPGAGRMLPGAAAAGGLAGSGLALLLIGQIARALLDQANATRDLAAVSRARAEHGATGEGHERH